MKRFDSVFAILIAIMARIRVIAKCYRVYFGTSLLHGQVRLEICTGSPGTSSLSLIRR